MRWLVAISVVMVASLSACPYRKQRRRLRAAVACLSRRQRVYTGGPMGDEANPRAGAGLFPETRWSRIVAARDRPELRRAVLDELCATRWQPLYLHLRKQGVKP